MSNNHGDIVIEDTTINAGGAKGYGYGPFAFDVCGYSSYNGVSVTVKGNSVINGNIEISRSSNKSPVGLTLERGTVTGELKIDRSITLGENTTITKSDSFKVAAPRQLQVGRRHADEDHLCHRSWRCQVRIPPESHRRGQV